MSDQLRIVATTPQAILIAASLKDRADKIMGDAESQPCDSDDPNPFMDQHRLAQDRADNLRFLADMISAAVTHNQSTAVLPTGLDTIRDDV